MGDAIDSVLDLDDAHPIGIDALLDLLAAPGVTVGVVRGRCDGWRLAAALCVDLLVAGPGATFGSAGDAYDAVLRRARALAGRHVAAYLAATDRMVDAATARQWGLVCIVADDPLDAARSLSEGIDQRSPVAIRTIIRLTRMGAARDLRTSRVTTRH